MRKIVVTGGAGFIGSHFTERLLEAFPDSRIIVLDKMTYAADIKNILPLLVDGRVQLVVADVSDYAVCRQVVDESDLVIHAAAESHVDRSFHSSILFTQANAVGTHSVMEACRSTQVPRIIHVSTDEVYGEVLEHECDEAWGLNPTNPYSASKAAAEMIVNGYRHSFNLPVLMVRANNVFGIRQYPEKLIPRTIMSLILGKKVPLHGNGRNVRHYLAASDFANALVKLIQFGAINEVYNVGSPDEYENCQVVRFICEEFEVNFNDAVEYVQDRPFNDRRYAISWEKIANLGWRPQLNLRTELPSVIRWYRENADHILQRMPDLGSVD